MTTEALIIQAAKDHFEAMSGRPTTLWTNENGEKSVPRVEFLEGPVDPRNLLLSGGADTDFLIQITVVTAAGGTEGQGYTTESDALAQLIIGHFAAGTTFAGARVKQRPARGAGFPDDDEWRLPITIRLDAILE